jgi:hypothetical protein
VCGPGARGAGQSDPIGVSDVQTGGLRDAVECCRPEHGAKVHVSKHILLGSMV